MSIDKDLRKEMEQELPNVEVKDIIHAVAELMTAYIDVKEDKKAAAAKLCGGLTAIIDVLTRRHAYAGVLTKVDSKGLAMAIHEYYHKLYLGYLKREYGEDAVNRAIGVNNALLTAVNNPNMEAEIKKLKERFLAEEDKNEQ